MDGSTFLTPKRIKLFIVCLSSSFFFFFLGGKQEHPLKLKNCTPNVAYKKHMYQLIIL